MSTFAHIHSFPRTPRTRSRHPLSILRTETVLSRFPIHNLTKRGPVTIHLHRTNAQGALDYHWEVSYNARYGQPGPLAYKLDTLVINQRLDALPRPLPRAPQSRQPAPDWDAARVLNTSGRQQGHLKTAFHQNASAYIVARVRYREPGGDGAPPRRGLYPLQCALYGRPAPRWHARRRRLSGAQRALS